jgi:hypothetical protein
MGTMFLKSTKQYQHNETHFEEERKIKDIVFNAFSTSKRLGEPIAQKERATYEHPISSRHSASRTLS